MDELSLLEAGSIEEAEAAASVTTGLESASTSLPAPDFTGSLDYIDSLASRSALSISRRDVADIATAALSSFDYLSPLINNKAVPLSADADFNVSTDFRPLGDARRYDPESLFRPPRALVRSASRVVSPRADFPPGWRNPLDPDRNTDDLNRAMREAERRIFRKPFAFRRPDQTIICLKRKLRRSVFHALGLSGLRGFRRPRYNYWSRVIC